MLLLGALLVLLTAGLWVYGLIDLLLTPATDCRHLRKGAWLAIAGLLFVPGAVAWLWFGRPLTAGGRCRTRLAADTSWLYGQPQGPVGPDADAALRRHPAGRALQDWTAESWPDEVTGEAGEQRQGLRPAGPDDDPEFLLYLDQVIRDIREAGNEA
jgi:hypothetical protein